ncbi:MAG TPA: Smr/MutS family protein, partial [Gemmatimonadales bacterium]|nr:Smr/MutS family protein [Gemmatimonadales bacterium]
IRMITEPSSLTRISRREELKAPADTAPLPTRPEGTRPAAPLEIDLRGMTGDEAEQATVAAVDAAVLAEQPSLRIIHGMGTGVVRDRVQRIVSRDRRISRYAFAPRNQGGTGVTIVEFPP